MFASRLLIILFLICSALSYAQDNSWDKVRYNGGSLSTKVDPKDWDNQLSVTSNAIYFQLKDGQKLEIPTKDVTGLSYGQEAHHRLSTIIALFGLFHKSRLHYVGIEYSSAGKKGGLLLQGDKDDYRAILLALESATHAPLSVVEKDREFLPESLQATVVKEADEGDVKATAKKESATLSLTSKPSGVDVYVDNTFAGSTPCTVTMDAGKHAVKLTAKDYQVWLRELKVREGEEMTINATMEK
jgi:PEGA domain